MRNKLKSILKIVLVTFLALVAVAYGGLLVLFKVHERSLVYRPSSTIAAEAGTLPHQTISLTSGDRVHITGWRIQPLARACSELWFLYFPGNSGNVSTNVGRLAVLQGLGTNILALDYRGFGASEGLPSEGGLRLDAEAAYWYLRNTERVPASRIILYGHSLGSAVAIDLASRVPVTGMVLEGAFTSLTKVGEAIFPILPISLIASNRYDSASKIGVIHCHELFIHATDDHSIPISFGRQLYQQAVGDKRLVEMRGDHNTIYLADKGKFVDAISSFLNDLPEREAWHACAPSERVVSLRP